MRFNWQIFQIFYRLFCIYEYKKLVKKYRRRKYKNLNCMIYNHTIDHSMNSIISDRSINQLENIKTFFDDTDDKSYLFPNKKSYGFER